jgi:hypothetical protein
MTGLGYLADEKERAMSGKYRVLHLKKAVLARRSGLPNPIIELFGSMQDLFVLIVSRLVEYQRNSSKVPSASK